LADDNYPGIDATSYGYLQNGSKYNNGSGSSYGNTFTTNDIIGVAYDAAGGKLWFSKNGTWQASGDPAAGTNAAFTSISTSLTYFPMFAASVTGTTSVNFGQRPFAYTAPSGFKALCTQNLPTPVIAQPSTAMDVKLYTGNGSTQTISGLGFSPDLVWIKRRDSAGNHALFDVIRGTGKFLESSTTGSESTSVNSLTAFNGDGFSLGTETQTNTNSATYCSWNWDAGSSTVTDNTGSIQSTRRTNASAGFSVVGWTGSSSSATIGHGLGVAPSMIIVKCRSSGGTGWPVYHQSLGGVDKVITLQSTGAVQTISNYWNTTAPSSTTFGVASGYDNNVNGATMIAYAFAPVAGFSAFGSYTGNGSSDGPFVFCGFRPRWILVKASSTSSTWTLLDAARNNYNVADARLFADTSEAEVSNGNGATDFLSNGFKIRVNHGGINSSGATYIYCAFAESPFQFSRAR
jgi:hypothetical protein